MIASDGVAAFERKSFVPSLKASNKATKMGKSSKNPRKKGRKAPDSNPYIREIERRLLEAPRRDWGPSNNAQVSETASHRDDTEWQGLSRELSVFQGERILRVGYNKHRITLFQWSVDPKYLRMREVILTTAMRYLVEYEYSGIFVPRLVRHLIMIFCAIAEVDEFKKNRKGEEEYAFPSIIGRLNTGCKCAVVCAADHFSIVFTVFIFKSFFSFFSGEGYWLRHKKPPLRSTIYL